MDPFFVLLVLVGLVVGVGVLAVAGVRKARRMSREHLSQLAKSGETERLSRPKTRQDYFLRPMSLRDVVLGVLGAVLLLAALRGIQSFLDG